MTGYALAFLKCSPGALGQFQIPKCSTTMFIPLHSVRKKLRIKSHLAQTISSHNMQATPQHSTNPEARFSHLSACDILAVTLCPLSPHISPPVSAIIALTWPTSPASTCKTPHHGRWCVTSLVLCRGSSLNTSSAFQQVSYRRTAWGAGQTRHRICTWHVCPAFLHDLAVVKISCRRYGSCRAARWDVSRLISLFARLSRHRTRSDDVTWGVFFLVTGVLQKGELRAYDTCPV